jgi:hypothetical protein
MKMLRQLLLLTVIPCASTFAQPKGYPSDYNVSWNTPSHDSWGSMPIGNGDIGANVWVTREGNLHLLISKTDSYSEIGRLLKVGELEISTTPSILDGARFEQTLVLDSGLIRIHGVKNGHKINISCRVQWDRPLIIVEATSDIPLQATIKQKPWRTASRLLTGNERHSGYGVAFREQPFSSEVDTIMSSREGLLWCHENKSSIWRMTLENQHIADFASGRTDPLLNQRFGALVTGDGMKPTDMLTLRTLEASRRIRVQTAVLRSQDNNILLWRKKLETHARRGITENRSSALARHITGWHAFFDQHYILVKHKEVGDTAYRITQGYLLQRYMSACAGRGSVPIKFNGSIFTTALENDLANGKKGFDADHRDWGGNFWFQNTRLLYWNMLMTGDHDLMRPLFDMYLKALPLARFRTKRYFGHDGAYFSETLTPWGSYLIDNYGWNRAGKPMGITDNMFIRYYWQGGLELSLMMMEYAAYSQDTVWFRKEMAPFISQIITFYDQHYPRKKDGKLLISPAQSLETYQEGMTDPLPEIAGLRYGLDKIIHQYSSYFSNSMLDTCQRLRNEIPDIPLETTVGGTRIAAGSNLGKRANIENPELYAIFPYRIFGLDKPGLELARRTFDTRIEKHVGCWYQDAIQAALLGRGYESASMVAQTFLSKHPGSRFPAFWGPNNDWVPDMDHGGGGMSALQYMLLQADDGGISLMPAWPKDWEVDFRMNIPGKQRISGAYRKTTGVTLTEKPESSRLRINEVQ